MIKCINMYEWEAGRKKNLSTTLNTFKRKNVLGWCFIADWLNLNDFFDLVDGGSRGTAG